VRITPSGVITEFAVPPSTASPRDIAAGSDGNLWFTSKPRRIGRITPSGTVTELADAVENEPGDIVLGPDGNLWFTEGSAIGRVTLR
jgi:virginiamycin B lyase